MSNHLDTTARDQLQFLECLVSSATKHASRAMTQWTNGQVKLSLDKLTEVSLDEASQLPEQGDEMLTMVVFGIEGSYTGQLLLVFDAENGKKLANNLIGKQSEAEPNAPWTALEQSAIMETGNILASAYLNELTRITHEKLTPTAPTFVQDFGASVLGQAIMMQAMTSDKIMICRTQFEFDSKHVNWNVYFLPSSELIENLKSTLHE